MDTTCVAVSEHPSHSQVVTATSYGNVRVVDSAAYDPDTMIAWGVADIHCRELGSFSMQELLDFRGRFNLPIERDLHYRPTTVATLLADAERR